MSNWKKHFAAVAFTVLALGQSAQAGVGGSANLIRDAVASGSTDAIVAEVERAEHLVCQDCLGVMTALLDHPEYEVREVAAWWFAKRPTMKAVLADQMRSDLAGTDSVGVRNAADFLGAVRDLASYPQLLAALGSGVSADARKHIVQAAGKIGDKRGNAVLVAGMADADASVRVAAADAYIDIRKQTDAAPLYTLLGDTDITVRAHAATAVGNLKGAGARATLEDLLAHDTDASVRRNAAWALGQIGDPASRDVLRAAQNDPSGLVRRFATAALAQLH